MLLREVVGSGARLFARIDFAPAGDHWPALSFMRREPLRELLQRFRPHSDVILLVGADDPIRLSRPSDRGRLLSAIQIDASLIKPTRDLVPPAALEHQKRRFGERWDLSLPLTRAWHFVHRPLMDGAYPDTFRKFCEPHKRGSIIEVPSLDVGRLLGEPVEPCRFDGARLSPHGGDAIAETIFESDLLRAVRGLADRSRKSGQLIVRRSARRSMPDAGRDTINSLRRIIVRQQGCCALCGGPISPDAGNMHLRLSIDRIDNRDKSYSADNIHITHLACNRGRNEGSLAEWIDYCAMLDSIPRDKRRQTVLALERRHASLAGASARQ